MAWSSTPWSYRRWSSWPHLIGGRELPATCAADPPGVLEAGAGLLPPGEAGGEEAVDERIDAALLIPGRGEPIRDGLVVLDGPTII
jgi:hypothetical protein